MSHHIGRYLAASAFILGLAVALVWVLVTDGGGAEPPRADDEGTETVARTEPSPSEPTSEQPQRSEPSEGVDKGTGNKREARLARLRKTDAYEAFAEYDRAKKAEWAKATVGLFAPGRDGQELFRFTNERELWNTIAPEVRDACLMAGPQAKQRLWNTDTLVPTGVDMTWLNKTTRGRGQFVQFICAVEGRKQPLWLVHGYLLDIAPSKSASVAARMRQIKLPESSVSTYEAARDLVLRRAWRWVQAQPKLPTGG